MKKTKHRVVLLLVGLLCGSVILSSCSATTNTNAAINVNNETKAATDKTKEINSAMYNLLDFSDNQEYTFATKGLIAAPEKLEIKDENGKVVWSQAAYDFVDTQDTADTVNPSLWRNTVLNHSYGLFEVSDGIYQVRGYDMSNLTLVETDSGYIVFDPLMSVECTKAAMDLVKENIGDKPIKAVIISHSHVDHYGGIKGLISEEDVADSSLSLDEQLDSGKIPIIVPEGFTEHAVSENIYAGNAMGRRASYQYGVVLDKGVEGSMSMGIGMGQSIGTQSFITPTYEIKETGESYTIDGTELEFQITPGTEAPAEMNTYFKDKRALWMAENCTGTLHNLYTLRGAQVRDGNAWANYINEAVTLYGDKTDVTFQSHNWPHWGNDIVNEYMTNTAAVYKYINDQTLMYINQGYTSDEISNMIELPEKLEKVWYTRQYYGTVAHNSKAVYQKYMGWYDANPVNLDPLTPTDSAKKYVEYLGDTNKVLELAKADFDKGEYKWVAEITNVLVYADPTNTDARYLCADALEQLGYEAESGTWRNCYLSAAKELRNGTTVDKSLIASNNADLKTNMTSEMMLDYIGILLDGSQAQNEDLEFNLVLTDTKENYYVHLYNGSLLYYSNTTKDNVETTVSCPKNALFAVISKNAEQQAQAIQIEGNKEILSTLNRYMVDFEFFFNIVEP